jgi:hypothetical protein
MKFLRSLLESLEVLYKFRVEVFNGEGDKVDEVKVIAGNEKEAEQLAVHKSAKKGKDAVKALAVEKDDVE